MPARYSGTIEKGLPRKVLIALASSANSDPRAAKALECLARLKGCQAHCSVMLSPPDESTYKKLGLQLTCQPKYQVNDNWAARWP